MSGVGVDRLARGVATALDRRRLLRVGAASLATVVAGMANGVDAKPGKNERERCKKKGQKCKREAAAYCARWWPAEFETCQYDHNQCCSLRSKCQEADAKKCASHLFWQRTDED